MGLSSTLQQVVRQVRMPALQSKMRVVLEIQKVRPALQLRVLAVRALAVQALAVLALAVPALMQLPLVLLMLLAPPLALLQLALLTLSPVAGLLEAGLPLAQVPIAFLPSLTPMMLPLVAVLPAPPLPMVALLQTSTRLQQSVTKMGRQPAQKLHSPRVLAQHPRVLAPRLPRAQEAQLPLVASVSLQPAPPEQSTPQWLTKFLIEEDPLEEAVTRAMPQAEAPPLEEGSVVALRHETVAVTTSGWALTSEKARAEELLEVVQPSLQHGLMSLGEACLPLCPGCFSLIR